MISTSSTLLAVAVAALMVLVVRAQEDNGLTAGADEILSAPYVDSFDCQGREYGYYGDVDNNCQVFHICYPIEDAEGLVAETAKWSFVCGNGTLWNQADLVCDHAENVDCSITTDLYNQVAFGEVLDQE